MIPARYQIANRVETFLPAVAWSRTLALAESLGLSVYDAAYLELALRRGLPLASLDDSLRRAMQKAGGRRLP